MPKDKVRNNIDYISAANAIKEAILGAQYESARGVNGIQLMLYFSIGRFLSLNTRNNKWGTGAIATISKLLKDDMPGLRGYSETHLKRMRTFYEEWSDLDPNLGIGNSTVKTGEFDISPKSPIQTGDFKAADEIQSPNDRLENNE